MNDVTIREQAEAASAAAKKLAGVSAAVKNEALCRMAAALLQQQTEILAANAEDMAAGREKQLKDSLLDRLLLSPERLADMAEGLRQVAALQDPVGEIIGGSQREERLDMLEARIRELGMNPEDYWWYCDLRRYGSCKHAGFGLGFERMVMYLTGVSNIRDVELHPRTVGNADF